MKLKVILFMLPALALIFAAIVPPLTLSGFSWTLDFSANLNGHLQRAFFRHEGGKLESGYFYWKFWCDRFENCIWYGVENDILYAVQPSGS